jgi:hypothetical protein
MRCYSHLSHDEREQIGLAQAHSTGAITQAISPNRRSGATSPATGCRADAIRRFHVAGVPECIKAQSA